nr:hypothetical protein [Tanacetum cinerariifolium]
MSASPEYLSGLACASLVKTWPSLKTHTVFGAIFFLSIAAYFALDSFLPCLHDLNELIIKYKIPRDLHPRLPSEESVMSQLPDDAIGVYHRIFDFYGVRIPFSLFLLALIKHYMVHFSQLGPLGLNKVVTFKRRAPSLVCIDDNHSYPKPPAGSFNMEDVRRLSVHVIKLRDMPEGVLVLSGLSHVWKSRTCDPVLQGANGNVMGIHDFVCLPEWTGAEVQDEPHHDISRPFRGFPFIVLLLLLSMSAMAQSFGSTTRPNLFANDSDAKSDDDDDACFKIPTITLIYSVAVIPSSRNQGGGSAVLVAGDPSTQGKGIMTDATVAPPVGASRPRTSSSPASLFKDISRDAIHRDFSPFLLVLIMPSILKVVLLETTVVDQFPTLGEMVWIEALSSDQLTAKMSVLHCLMSRMVMSSWLDIMISKHAAKPLSVILQLEPKKLAHLVNFPTSRDSCVSPPLVKQLIVTPASESLELPSYIILASSTTALDPNKECVNEMVDGAGP